jgi:hypothetical protein
MREDRAAATAVEISVIDGSARIQ